MSKKHACGFPIVHIVSSHDGSGIDSFKHSITELMYSSASDDNNDTMALSSSASAMELRNPTI